jgi:hypothetical protein
MGDVLPVVDDLAAGRLEQPRDEARHGRLPAAGLADEPERPSARDLERDAVHRVHLPALAAEEDAAGEREQLLEVVDREQGGAWAPPRAVPRDVRRARRGGLGAGPHVRVSCDARTSAPIARRSAVGR